MTTEPNTTSRIVEVVTDMTDSQAIEVLSYYHYVRVGDKSAIPPAYNFNLKEHVLSVYPNLEEAAIDLVFVALELLAYQRGSKGGLTETARRAGRALAKAKGEPVAA